MPTLISINIKTYGRFTVSQYSCLILRISLIFFYISRGLFLLLINITPKGVHPLMCVLLVPVELISTLIRPISLAVRMFANLVMGHIMIAGLNFVTAYPCGGW